MLLFLSFLPHFSKLLKPLLPAAFAAIELMTCLTFYREALGLLIF